MITPTQITKYDRTQSELEEFLLFTILVAGKKANITAKKLDSFLDKRKMFGLENMSPFQFIEYLDKSNLLLTIIKSVKLGQYNRISGAFKQALQLKDYLKTITPYELEAIKGIGFKTSRFFVLHTRPNQNYAVLDTHILRWLRDHGVDAPKTTPTGKKYMELEKKFLQYSEQYGINPAHLDLQIWTQYSKTK
jgi:thermostable 8-oxoguanine DNA glycosylase